MEFSELSTYSTVCYTTTHVMCTYVAYVIKSLAVCYLQWLQISPMSLSVFTIDAELHWH